jgi:hypothetical protein
MNLHDPYSPEQPSRSLIEAVCVRPRMYTIGGTLEEAGAFLQGFYSGMAAHNQNPAALKEAGRWSDFCTWAAERVEGATPGGWYQLFQALRRAYPEDVGAFVQLRTLYHEFRQECDEGIG